MRFESACHKTRGFVLLVFIVFFGSLLWPGEAYAQEIAPDFTLTDIEGNEFSLQDFRGTTVLLSFVATRIIFCKMQVLIFNNISRYFEDDVVIILVSVSNETFWIGDHNDRQLRIFSEDCSFEGVVARDTAGVTEAYDVAYLPTTYIIDQEGHIRHKHVGVADAMEDDLKEELEIVIPEFSSTILLLIYIVTAILSVAVTKYRKDSGASSLCATTEQTNPPYRT